MYADNGDDFASLQSHGGFSPLGWRCILGAVHVNTRTE